MHLLLSSMSVVYVLTTPILEDVEDAIVEQLRKRPSEIMMTMFAECGKPKKLKKDCKGGKVGNKANGLGINGPVNDSSNSLKGATVHVYKNRCWFKTYESLNDGSILHMGNELTTLVYRCGCVDLKFSSEKIVSLTESMVLGAIVRLPDPKLKTLGERGIECIFIGYAEHSKAFRLGHVHYKRMQDMSKDGLILAFDMDTKKFPRPSLRIPNRTKDIGGSVVPKEVTKEDGPKTFDEVMKSQDVAFWKESINNEMDSIMDNNTWVLVNLPIVMDVKIVFLNGELDEDVYINKPQGFIMPSNENKVDMTKEFLSSRFSMTEMGEADVILVSTPMDTSEKLMPNNGQVVSQLEYSGVIGCLMYAITCTRPDNAFAVGKLSRYTSNPVLEGYIDASWIGNTEYNSCNQWLVIPAWWSVQNIAKLYHQMYNQKSRHLGVRHNMIYELIMNGVVSIEFVRSQHNLADHLTKGLARDLVLMCAEGVCLKSN
ncbi:hypothetical protein Tco_1309799 [Tanacetum coccineum]